MATFDDYLADVERWLKQSFHLRDLRDSLISRLVSQYIERLSEDDIEFRHDEMERVAETVLQDAEAIQEYCRKHRQTQQPESNSEESKVNQSIVVLELVSNFFSSPDPTIVFPELAKELGNSVGPVLRRLLKYRSDLPENQTQQLLLDLTELELWAEHNAPSSTRFHVVREQDSATSGTRVQKAQELIGKGLKKAKAEAKAKRTSFVKGVQVVSKAAKGAPFRRRSKTPE